MVVEPTVAAHPADVHVAEGGGGDRTVGALRREEDGARVRGERVELGVEPAEQEGPLDEHDGTTGDDGQHGEHAHRDDEPAAQRHHGSRTV